MIMHTLQNEPLQVICSQTSEDLDAANPAGIELASSTKELPHEVTAQGQLQMQPIQASSRIAALEPRNLCQTSKCTT